MSAAMVPPPPPEPELPPLPTEDPPPLPSEPPPSSTMNLQQYTFSSQQYVGASAAYPYAYQPLYQYPLQQPYQPQSHTAYSPYSPYVSSGSTWSVAQSHSHVAPTAYQPNLSCQPVQHQTNAGSSALYSNVASYQPISTCAPALASTSSAPGPAASLNSGPISFSLHSAQQQSALVQNYKSQVAPSAESYQKENDVTALKDWIRRGLKKYSKLHEGRIREAMKAVIEEKKCNGAMYTHDWDREPIPDLLNVNKLPTPPKRKDNSVPQPQPACDDHPVIVNRRVSMSDDTSTTVKSLKKRNKKRKRETNMSADTRDGLSTSVSCEPAYSMTSDVIISGTCQALEKSFLRLNGVPKPEEVRPEPVLIQAIDRMSNLIAGGEKDFMYVWSQLKAIRQDLTVQHIRSATAVRLEELFARAALEHADQQEFRKCVSTLQTYYDEGLPGCKEEFGAYQLLLYICIEQKNRALSIARAMPQLVAQGSWESSAVKHAREVLHANSTSNFAKFWKLYESAPNCSRRVMDWGVDNVRLNILKAASESYRSVPIFHCMRMLGFLGPSVHQSRSSRCTLLPGCTQSSCEEQVRVSGVDTDASVQMKECIDCIEKHKGLVVEQGGELVFDAKASVQRIIKPPPEQNTAKAVGNTHLNAGAFLKEAVKR